MAYQLQLLEARALKSTATPNIPFNSNTVPYIKSKQHDPRRVVGDAGSPSTTVALLPCFKTVAPIRKPGPRARMAVQEVIVHRSFDRSERGRG